MSGWLERAACAQHRDPTLWDVDHVRHMHLVDRCGKCAEALRVCDGCPVRRECGAAAEQCGEVEVLRGGWALVAGRRDRRRSRAHSAARCAQCTLPVLRGALARYCSAVCARRGAVRTRREAQARRRLASDVVRAA